MVTSLPATGSEKPLEGTGVEERKAGKIKEGRIKAGSYKDIALTGTRDYDGSD